MKLSEAVMLGSATVKMVPGDIDSCALGAACTAVGIAKHHTAHLMNVSEGAFYWTTPAGREQRYAPVIKFTDRYDEMLKMWPWLNAAVPWVQTAQQHDGGRKSVACWNLVAGRFDMVVCRGEQTLEQLVDTVVSMEPECGDCNRFRCTCAVDEAWKEINALLATQLMEAFAKCVPMKVEASHGELWKTELDDAAVNGSWKTKLETSELTCQ